MLSICPKTSFLKRRDFCAYEGVKRQSAKRLRSSLVIGLWKLMQVYGNLNLLGNFVQIFMASTKRILLFDTVTDGHH